ncbi:hypothetical protein [Fuerstiella marisgermanici]|uniref:Uncharacterized protein n=1 Tax=Fuerstiella marisgermanici TaxID=1891926 RepID=A0A1P8WNH2_9PLAN|nr:hypothetical protein [Fuerstiella marisgermanici]APZ95606.1 hypothetical protein Fuma_05265 [Fuerstiella marisgermanici]
MADDLPDFSRLPEDSAKDLHRFGVGMFVALLVLLLLAVVYSIGQKIEGFRWNTFRNGLFTFGLILLSVCATVVAMTFAIRGMTLLWPEAMQRSAERRKLKKATHDATSAIAERQRLNEERARLTAQLQATYLFEKETSDAANAKASQAFREALQSSVLQSCQIAFDHINKVVEQYEQVVKEIELSELPSGDKTELLNSLAKQLDVAATEERNKDAQKMMESEIWKVRFRKARLIAKDSPAAAVRYLNRIQQEARGPKLKARIQVMIDSISAVSDPTP